MFITGLMNPISNGPILAVMQAKVAPEMQGRVFTVVGSLCSAMSPLAMAIAGPVADRLGVGFWYALGGAACILIGMGGFFIPAILRFEDHEPARAAEQSASV
jgi:DHA3 family macrolide efflux protein-like MFS transporter